MEGSYSLRAYGAIAVPPSTLAEMLRIGDIEDLESLVEACYGLQYEFSLILYKFEVENVRRKSVTHSNIPGKN
jgi:hypothetical protein